MTLQRINNIQGYSEKNAYLQKVVKDFAPKGPEESIIMAYLLSTQNASDTLKFSDAYKRDIHHYRWLKIRNILLELK